jgi:hypothetical protein
MPLKCAKMLDHPELENSSFEWSKFLGAGQSLFSPSFGESALDGDAPKAQVNLRLDQDVSPAPAHLSSFSKHRMSDENAAKSPHPERHHPVLRRSASITVRRAALIRV